MSFYNVEYGWRWYGCLIVSLVTAMPSLQDLSHRLGLHLLLMLDSQVGLSENSHFDGRRQLLRARCL